MAQWISGQASWPPPPSSGPNPQEPRSSPFLRLGTGQSEAQIWLFLSKHTRAHVEPPGVPPERDTAGYSPTPGTGAANNAARRVPLIEAASEQQGHWLD